MEKTIFRKAGELKDYSSFSFPNNYGDLEIEVKKKVHTYCRLGGDVYTNNLTIRFLLGETQCDFVYLDKAIEERFEQSDSIIEEVIHGVFEIVKNQCPDVKEVLIISEVTDSVPKDMPVKITFHWSLMDEMMNYLSEKIKEKEDESVDTDIRRS